MEPEKCAGWNWTRWEDIANQNQNQNQNQERLFAPLGNLVQQGFDPRVCYQ